MVHMLDGYRILLGEGFAVPAFKNRAKRSARAEERPRAER